MVSLHRRNPMQQERGAALIVALVLVLISTLLGVSAMQSSGIETQLAANTRFQQDTFRAAEAAADQLLTIENLTALVNNPATPITTTETVNEVTEVEAEFIALGAGPATGYSLGGVNGFSALKFVATSTATTASVESSTGIIQGIERISASTEQ